MRSTAIPSGPLSCAIRPPVAAHATSPHTSNIGTRSVNAAVTPVIAFVAPGPAVTSTAATRPVARW